jgi:peptidoglycan/xylan/chitin deacetylase (PgdA/CDA1 family)
VEVRRTVELIDRVVPGGRRDFIGHGRRPPRVVWPNRAKVVVSLYVNYEEGSEYSIPAGDGRNESVSEVNFSMGPEYRDLCTESTYEFGSRAGIWRLMRMFDEYGIKVTFFACAVALQRNPEVAAWLKESGHEPCSHGWRWIENWKLSREQEKEYMQRAIESIEETCGERPRGWYSRYAPSVHTRELVVEEGGFIYDSDAYNDDLPYFTTVNDKQHLVIPSTLVYNDGKYMPTQGFGGPTDFLDACRRGLDELWREGNEGFPKMMSLSLHPRWVGQANRANGLRDFIEYAMAKGDVWFARRVDIAEWWIGHHAEWE